MHHFESRRSILTPLFLSLILIFGFYLRLRGNSWGLPIEGRFTVLNGEEYNDLNFIRGMHPSLHHIDSPIWFIDPTFFYYQLTAFLGMASAVHMINLTPDRTFYLEHPDQYGRLFEAGRFFVGLYGLCGIALFFLLGRSIAQSNLAGLISSFFYATIPLAVVSCHVIDFGVVMSAWLAITFYCLWRSLQEGKERWLVVGAIAAGLTFSTKYTAAPVFLLFPYCLWRLRASVRTIIKIILLGVGGFVLGTPFSVLNYLNFCQDFYSTFLFFGKLHDPWVPHHLIYPFLHFPYAVGSLLTLMCFIGLGIELRKKTDAGILASLFVFSYLFLLTLNTKHYVRYMNELLPFLLPFAGVSLLPFFRSSRIPGKVIGFILLCFCLSRVPYTFAINHSLASEVAPQDRASDWVRAHIPGGSTIGIEYTPDFMWPGNLYMQYWKNMRYPPAFVLPPSYKFQKWNIYGRRWDGEPPSYCVTTNYYFYTGYRKVQNGFYEAAQYASKAMTADYVPLAEFSRQVRWGPFSYQFPTHGGLDWRIFFPEIAIYARKQPNE